MQVQEALPAGQHIHSITITGPQKTDVDGPASPQTDLTPSAIEIYSDDNSTRLTDYYLIETTSYIPGKLSVTMPGDVNVTITALEQRLTYNGLPQGLPRRTFRMVSAPM